MSIKQILYMLLGSGSFLPRLRGRMLPNGITVLMYHELANDDSDIEAWTVVRKSEFLHQVDYLRRHFDIVTLDQALERIDEDAIPSRPLVVLTLDDGDSGNHDVLLPIVEAHEIPVTIYVATGQVEDQRPYWFDRVINALQGDEPQTIDMTQEGLDRYVINRTRGARNWGEIQRLLVGLKSLSGDQRERAVERIVALEPNGARRYRVKPLTVADVQALARSRWITLGAHSHCHSLLTRLSPSDAEYSIAHSRDLLREWTGSEIVHFAYPSGDYNPAVMQCVERLGFSSAMSAMHGLWRKGDSRFAIPRIGVGRYDSLDTFKVNLAGGVRYLARQFMA